MLYGDPKVGKTTFIHKLFKDRVLFIGTEQRHDAIPGIHVQHITTWSQYLQVLSQLQQPALKEKYDVICIDTTTNLYNFLEKYIKNKYNVQNLSEVAYGAAWGELKNEWNQGITALELFGYNPVFVFHSKNETETRPLESTGGKLKEDLENNLGESVNLVRNKSGKSFYEVNRTTYDGADRVIAPVNKMVDNIMYIEKITTADGEEKRMLRLRGNLFYDAGSAFENIVDSVPLDPEAYTKAIEDAVTSLGEDNITDENIRDRRQDTIEHDFDALMVEAKELGAKLFELKKQKELQHIVDETFGSGNKLTDATPTQVESLIVAISEMKKLIG